MSKALDHALNLSVFPSEAEGFRELYSFYDKNTPVIISLVLMLLLVRALIAMASVKGAESYFEIIKDVFVTFIVLIGFKTFIEYSGALPRLIVEHLGILHQTEIDLSKDVSFWTEKFVEWSDWITFGVTILTAIIYFITIGIFCILGPFIIVFSVMLNRMWVLSFMVISVVVVSLWPVVWYIVNIAIIYIANHADAWVNIITVIFGTIGKFVSPYFLFRMLTKNSGLSGAKNNLNSGMNDLGSGAGKMTNAGAKVISGFGGQPAMDNMKNKYKGMKSGVVGAIKKQTHKVIPGIGGMAVGAVSMAASGVKKVGKKVAGHFANGGKNTGASASDGMGQEVQANAEGPSANTESSSQTSNSNSGGSTSGFTSDSVDPVNNAGAGADSVASQTQPNNTGPFKRKVKKRCGRKSAGKSKTKSSSVEAMSGSDQSDQNQAAFQKSAESAKTNSETATNGETVKPIKSSGNENSSNKREDKPFSNPKPVEGVEA